LFEQNPVVKQPPAIPSRGWLLFVKTSVTTLLLKLRLGEKFFEEHVNVRAS
jgi:hypothetical protein